MQLFGASWSWNPFGSPPPGPPPMVAPPAAIAPVTIIDLMSSGNFLSWAADIMSHKALLLQIGVALCLVCMVVGLLNICYMQAEMLLGRIKLARHRRDEDKGSRPRGQRAGPGLGGSDMDVHDNHRYRMQWAELERARVDWRMKKMESSMTRAGRLLTNLDGRVRRLEGTLEATLEATLHAKAPSGAPKRAADGASLYPLMQRPESPRPPHGYSLHDGELHACTTMDSLSSSASMTPSLGAEHAGTEEQRDSDLAEAGQWPFDPTWLEDTPAVSGAPRAERRVEQSGDRLAAAGKDLQLKYESAAWRRKDKGRPRSLDRALGGHDRQQLQQLQQLDVEAPGGELPQLPPMSRTDERPKSCPSSQALAGLHQTIDESQMTIAADGEAAAAAGPSPRPSASPKVAADADPFPSVDLRGRLGGGWGADLGDSDDGTSVESASRRSARKSYENSLDRLGRREWEQRRQQPSPSLRSRGAALDLMDCAGQKDGPGAADSGYSGLSAQSSIKG